MLKRILGVAVTAVALSLAALTGTASASTPGCTGGAYAGYCGTQTDTEASPLSLDVKQGVAAYNQPVIGYTDDANDAATDFINLPYDGDNTKGVIMVFAPAGVPSRFCVSDPGDGLVRLRVCNGSKWQRFVAAPVVGSQSVVTGFTWTNVATGHILQANGYRNQVTTVAAPASPATPTSGQQFNFVG